MPEETKKPSPVITFILILLFVAILGFLAQLGLDRLTAKQFPQYETIEVPIIVSFLRSEDPLINSTRNVDDATNMMKEINEMWANSGIFFRMLRVQDVSLPYLASRDVEYLKDYLETIPENDSTVINFYFVKEIDTLNGIAFPSDNIFFLADNVSVSEARTAGHEIGHILGLPHIIVDRQSLMNPGSGGRELSLAEVEVAREFAGLY